MLILVSTSITHTMQQQEIATLQTLSAHALAKKLHIANANTLQWYEEILPQECKEKINKALLTFTIEDSNLKDTLLSLVPVTAKTLSGHKWSVYSVCFSPDSQTLASGSSDTTIKLWDLITHTCIKTFHGHNWAVWSVCFSPDGKTLASGSLDDTIKLWDLAAVQKLSIALPSLPLTTLVEWHQKCKNNKLAYTDIKKFL